MVYMCVYSYDYGQDGGETDSGLYKSAHKTRGLLKEAVSMAVSKEMLTSNSFRKNQAESGPSRTLRTSRLTPKTQNQKSISIFYIHFQLCEKETTPS